MAITNLITPANGGTVLFPTKTSTTSINLAAGTNRRVLVAVCGREQGASLPPQTIPVVTYGGVPMEFMPRAVDSAESFITGGTASRVSVFWFCLRESQLPANGAQDLVVDWQALAGTNWGFRSTLYELNNVDQGIQIRDHRRVASTAGGTTIGSTTLPGGASDAILVAGMNALSSGTFQITIDGVGITEDFDAAISSIGRCTFGNDLSAGAVAGIPFLLTFSNGNNVAAVGLRLAEFFAVNPGNAVIYGGPGSAVSLEAS